MPELLEYETRCDCGVIFVGEGTLCTACDLRRLKKAARVADLDGRRDRAVRRERGASAAVRKASPRASSLRDALAVAQRSAQIEVDALSLLLETMSEETAIAEFGPELDEQIEGARLRVMTDAEVGCFGPERFGAE